MNIYKKYFVIGLTILFISSSVGASVVQNNYAEKNKNTFIIPGHEHKPSQIGRAWFDNFDTYDTGQFLDGGSEDGGWKGWDDDPSLGAYVVDDPYLSSPHSVDIEGNSDLVHEFSDYTSGQWRFLAWQYIPDDFTGQSYFILLSDYADVDPGTNSKWAIQIKFDSSGFVESEFDSVTLPLIKEEWVLLRTEIDLDIDWFEFYYNEELLIAKAWTATPSNSNDGLLQIDAVDLFANGASSIFYDDLSLDVPQSLSCDANGPYIGNINEDIEMDGTASGGIPPWEFLWDFGDGETSDDPHPTHNYVDAGNYTVTLTVTDNVDNTASDTTWALINTNPGAPIIDGSISGEPDIYYTYTFTSTDPDNNDIAEYIINWDDGNEDTITGPFPSGTPQSKGHRWSSSGKYIIKAKAIDIYGGESDWGELEITMPRNRATNQVLFRYLQYLQNFLPALKILTQLLS